MRSSINQLWKNKPSFSLCNPQKCFASNISTVSDVVQQPQRISKIISSTGICSLREAKKLISEGKITINGVTCFSSSMQTTLKGDELIKVDGVHLNKNIRSKGPVYGQFTNCVVNWSRNVIATKHDLY